MLHQESIIHKWQGSKICHLQSDQNVPPQSLFYGFSALRFGIFGDIYIYMYVCIYNIYVYIYVCVYNIIYIYIYIIYYTHTHTQNLFQSTPSSSPSSCPSSTILINIDIDQPHCKSFPTVSATVSSTS